MIDRVTRAAEQGSIIPFGAYDWRVLDVKNAKALLLSERVIGRMRYHSSYENITWAECELHDYLNGEFYSSFNASDKARIAETLVKTNNNPWYGTSGGADTRDMIFLLSLEEVVKYFGDSGKLKQANLKENQSGFSDLYDSDRIAKDKAGNAVWWWLRSPGDYNHEAAFVLADGYVRISGDGVDMDIVGVRPALWLNL